MQHHVLKTDEELMTAFKLFDERNFSSIEFELESMPIAVEFPDEPVGLLQYNVGPSDFIIDDVEMVHLDLNNDHGTPRPNNVELEDFDTDFQPNDVSSEDSYINLVDDDVNGDHPVEQCDPDGDPLGSDHSSDDEDGLLKIARYCVKNQWVPMMMGPLNFALVRYLAM
ncbi:hypothetical protein ACOSP7_008275 [Xanthoceras sorbifolium]